MCFGPWGHKELDTTEPLNNNSKILATSFTGNDLDVNNSEKAVAPHSSTLAWKIPWMEEPGGPQSTGS